MALGITALVISIVTLGLFVWLHIRVKKVEAIKPEMPEGPGKQIYGDSFYQK